MAVRKIPVSNQTVMEEEPREARHRCEISSWFTQKCQCCSGN